MIGWFTAAYNIINKKNKKLKPPSWAARLGK
jgi:hypothetical protein